MTLRTLWAAAAAAPIATALAAGPVTAQDVGSPWSGFYVGAVAGAAWGDTKAHATVSTPSGATVIPPQDAALINSATSHDETKSGFAGGVEGGYNYRMGDWLFGAEADWTTLDLKNSNTKTAQSLLLINPPITYTLNQQIRTDWMVTLRPRVGYVFGPWLVYGTAGLAWSELKYRVDLSDNRVPANAVSASSNSTKTGWVAGVGAGYAFTPSVSLKGEWLYADFGHVGSATTNNFVSITPEDSVKSHMFRVGLDYRF